MIPSKYKDTEIGPIPKEWSVKKQGDISTFYNGRAYKQKEFVEAGTPIVRIQNLTGRQNYVYSNLELPESKYINKGDLIYAWSATFGPYIWQGPKAIYHYHIWKIEVDKDVIDKIFYFYRLHFISKETNSQKSGAVFAHLTKGFMESYEIAIPPLKEQQKIAAILSSVDAAIEKTEQIIEQTEVIKKGLIKQLLSKGLGHVEFMNSPIGKIPRKWKLKEFKDVMVLQRGYDLPTKERNRGSYPLLSANGVTDYIDEYKVEGPGVITGRSGTIGKVHFIENSYWPLNTSLYVKEMYDNNPRFLYYLLLSLKLERFSTRTSVPTLNRNIVHKEKVQVPPSSEQNQIVKILDSIGNKVKKESQKLDSLFLLKQGLMQQLLTGKVRVPIDENKEVSL